MSILLLVATLALSVLGLVILSRTADDDVRFLPKFPWAIIIVLLPLLGTIAFLLIGRRWATPVARAPRRARSAPPRPTRAVETTPEEDEAAIEAEIRYHEQQAEIRRLEAKLARERDEGTEPRTSGEPSGKT